MKLRALIYRFEEGGSNIVLVRWRLWLWWWKDDAKAAGILRGSES